ncbi:hypothetical protein [Frankia sp. QA3]|uniref:hypothetical protein n=1 Tax=Frankia sp. QA3 TaxID=710111 RepID=UPI000269CF68|nr:hypothetical protein [Frankia sp. QA3]EIV96333.1 hypothetical protein FraQA3DRAFT_6220 [Frankia sp. QA3]
MATAHPVTTSHPKDQQAPSTEVVSSRPDPDRRGIRLTRRATRFAGSAVLAGVAGAFAAYPAGHFWEWVANLPGLPI